MTEDEAREINWERCRYYGSNGITRLTGLMQGLFRSAVTADKYPGVVGYGYDGNYRIATAKAWLDMQAQVRARGGV